MSAVEARTRELIAELSPRGVSGDELAPDANLIDDLDFDSLALLELAAAIEREFQLPPLSEEDVLDVQTVAQVTDLVSRYARPAEAS